jgi:phosphoribosyl-ATP pyrophosphohydrolase
MTDPTMLARLEQTIAQRKAEMPEGSYTTYLFTQGQDKILKKLGEETAETLIASKNNSRDELVYEASDLIYHLLVLLAHHDVPWSAIEAELSRRHLSHTTEAEPA